MDWKYEPQRLHAQRMRPLNIQLERAGFTYLYDTVAIQSGKYLAGYDYLVYLDLETAPPFSHYFIAPQTAEAELWLQLNVGDC